MRRLIAVVLLSAIFVGCKSKPQNQIKEPTIDTTPEKLIGVWITYSEIGDMAEKDFPHIFWQIAAYKFAVTSDCKCLFKAVGELMGNIAAVAIERTVTLLYSLNSCGKYESECYIRITGSVSGTNFNCRSNSFYS